MRPAPSPTAACAASSVTSLARDSNTEAGGLGAPSIQAGRAGAPRRAGVFRQVGDELVELRLHARRAVRGAVAPRGAAAVGDRRRGVRGVWGREVAVEEPE
jgi:hypothetical protein